MQNQRIKILIVEDDPDMAELIADLVEAEGWSPTVVHSAEDATATLVARAVPYRSARPQSARDFREDICSTRPHEPGAQCRHPDGHGRRQCHRTCPRAGNSGRRLCRKTLRADRTDGSHQAVLRRIAPSLKVEKEPEREHEASSLRLGDWAVDLSARARSALPIAARR